MGAAQRRSPRRPGAGAADVAAGQSPGRRPVHRIVHRAGHAHASDREHRRAVGGLRPPLGDFGGGHAGTLCAHCGRLDRKPRKPLERSGGTDRRGSRASVAAVPGGWPARPSTRAGWASTRFCLPGPAHWWAATRGDDGAQRRETLVHAGDFADSDVVRECLHQRDRFSDSGDELTARHGSCDGRFARVDAEFRHDGHADRLGLSARRHRRTIRSRSRFGV